MDKKKLGFTTRQIHGEGHDKPLHAHNMPIFQSSTYMFDSPDHGAALFAGEIKGHIYTRLGNPTTEALERTLTNLEEAEASVVFPSGLAAIQGATLPFMKHGDHIISGDTLYGPTLSLFGDIYARYGISTTFVNTANPDEVRKAIRPETKFCFYETPANPTNKVSDIAAISEICRHAGVKSVIDNTFATPYNQTPLTLGTDIVIHSATKYLNGHGDIIGGCAMGKSEDMDIVRTYRTATGPCISPFDSYLFLRGLKTLSMRMDRHNKNGLAVAEFLHDHPDVDKVMYPGLPDDPGYKVAKKQMRGFSGMVAFELKGGFQAAKEVLQNTKLFILAVSLGTVDSLIQHPASMTHAKVSKEFREKQGLTDNLIRISVGCEDTEDLIADLGQAIEKAKAAVGA